MNTMSSQRLDGLQPDNLLAFLTLLGLLRAMEADDATRAEAERMHPRAAWDIDHLPLRPRLFLARNIDRQETLQRIASGIDLVAASYEFESRKDLDYSQQECRKLLEDQARTSSVSSRHRADLLASLVSDAAIKDTKDQPVDPTPLCLLFGQGHQHFLERLAEVPREAAPPPRGKGKKAAKVSPSECLDEALFRHWNRDDPTSSFRWDPEEEVRYALMAGDPTDAAYKSGTQHGANRLATLGLGVLTLVPEMRLGRVRPLIVGGEFSSDGFSFAWPIWRYPATLAAIRALLAHPTLRKAETLAYLGVTDVQVARRISVGKFMNFTRARSLTEEVVGEA